jgi:hypothetical protein
VATLGCALALTLGCGGNTDLGLADGGGTGGAAGSSGSAGNGASAGSSGSGGVAGSGAVSGSGGTGGASDCLRPSSERPPYATRFVFENRGPRPAYVRRDCHVALDVTSCTDGFVRPIQLEGDCTKDCSDPTAGCIACGPCPSGLEAVDGKKLVERSWSGASFVFSNDSSGCPCHTATPAPAARYRVDVPVWDEAADPGGPLPLPSRSVSVEFELPAPNGEVIVDVAP